MCVKLTRQLKLCESMPRGAKGIDLRAVIR